MDTPEDDISLRKMAEALNAGEPLPTVDPEELKSIWPIVRRSHLHNRGQQIAIGFDLFSAAIPNHRALGMAEGMNLLLRAQLLNVLLDGGTLTEFESGDELMDVVFRAAATMPMNSLDIVELTMRTHSSQVSEMDKAAWEAEAASQGRRSIEEKFLAALHEGQ